ncbi:MAG: antibiotic biosynthesis monooxygenase [Ignavibacteriae bacterium]|nr:MAG: antibiotic biosynthesis monooxygenase [Ignavibacteriota bacterium]
MASRLRDLALGLCNCREFVAATSAGQEISLSYWDSEEDIRAWKAQSDHVIAQQLGRKDWYTSYEVQVAEIKRSYSF